MSVTYGGIEQSYAYDALGNQTFFRNGLGNAVYWSYDNAGLLLSQTNSTGVRTEYRYDAFGQQIYKGEAATLSGSSATAQRITRSTYNNRGLLTAQGETDVAGNWKANSLTHVFTYDQAGRRVTDSIGTSLVDGRTVYTRYDAAGQVLQSRSIGGVVTSYSYNNAGRKTSEQIAGLAANLQTWSYDTFGNVTQLVQGAKTTTYTLTAHKEVATATTGSEVRTYTYYGNGWVQSIEDKDTSATGTWATLGADLAKWKSNNVGGTNMTTTSSGAVRIDSSTYTYNALGQRVTESSSSQRQVVRTATWQEAQTYGAPITKTLSETLLYSSSRTINSTYDAQGRLVQVSSPQGKVTPTILDSAVSTYGYTPPTNVNVDQASGLLALTYAYDAAGNRRQVQSQTYKTATKGVVETKNYYYLYTADNVLYFANATSANANYTAAASWQQDTRYMLTDALGRRIGEKAKDGNNYSYQKYDYLYGSSNVGSQYETKATTSFLDLSGTTLSKHYARSYDDWGRLVTQSTYAIYAGEGHSLSTVGRLIGTDTYSWNSSNQLTTQTSKKEVVDVEYVSPPTTTPTNPYGGPPSVATTQTAVMVTASVVNYTSYDSAGNLTAYSVNAYKTDVSFANNTTKNVVDYTETHTKTYNFLGGSYQLLSDAVATTKNKWRPSSLSYYYTNTGELMYVRGTNTTVDGHDRFMVANRDGQLMSRRDGKKLQDYYYSNGQVLGTAGTLLTPGKADFASDFSSNVQSQSEMALTSPGTYTVQSGDTLQSIAGKLWGDSSLWYVLADANGIESNSLLTDGVQLTIPSVNETLHNTSSTFKPYNASSIIGASEAQPIAPPAPSQCGAMLVTLVVIIVAAVVTYGASLALTAAAGGTAAVTGGTAVAVGMGAAAAGAMAGNVAGQLVGMAIGQQDGFDLGSVFKAGARGALAAGVGAIAGAAGGLAGEAGEIGYIATQSAVQAAGNYLINKAMTGEGGFSWAGIAANVAGSVAGHYAGAQIAGDGTDANLLMMRDMASNFAGGWAENSARQWLGIGGKREWSDIAIDAFGNAVGNSIAGSYQKEAGDEVQRQQLIADQIDKLEGDYLNVYNEAMAANKYGKEVTKETALELASLVDLRDKVNAMSEDLTTRADTTSTDYQELLKERNLAVASLLATDVYFDKPLASLLPDGVTAVLANKALKGYGVSADQLNTESGYFARIYNDSLTNAPILVDRGTEMDRGVGAMVNDWIANIGQGLGIKVDQYKQAMSVATQIVKSQNGKELTFVGHSLGGGLASAQALATGHSAITFNSAGLHEDTVNKPQGNANDLVKAYWLDGEILSSLQDSKYSIMPTAVGRRDMWSVNNFNHKSTPSSLDKHGMTYVARSLGAYSLGLFNE
ncbi:LysM peptidoglycan-binding domain-containing protein [Pseudaeromonas pectinilytica]